MAKRRSSVVRCTAKDGTTREIVEIAGRRSADLLRHWRLMDWDIRILIRSCYIQGMIDMAAAVAGQQQMQDVGDYQI